MINENDGNVTVFGSENDLVQASTAIHRKNDGFHRTINSVLESIPKVKAKDRTGQNVQRSLAEMDQEYMQAVNNGDDAKARELMEQAATKAGYTIKAYHGTPTGGFTEFKGWSYFTENKAYADRYKRQGGPKSTTNKTGLLLICLNAKGGNEECY